MTPREMTDKEVIELAGNVLCELHERNLLNVLSSSGIAANAWQECMVREVRTIREVNRVTIFIDSPQPK